MSWRVITNDKGEWIRQVKFMPIEEKDDWGRKTNKVFFCPFDKLGKSPIPQLWLVNDTYPDAVHKINKTANGYVYHYPDQYILRKYPEFVNGVYFPAKSVQKIVKQKENAMGEQEFFSWLEKKVGLFTRLMIELRFKQYELESCG